MDYCVYGHVRDDDFKVFYIGKGNRRRPYDKSRRSEYWKNVVSKTSYKIKIFKFDLTEDQAFELEHKLIIEYKKLGECDANIAYGGKGTTGYRHSDEAKCKIRMASKVRGGGKIGGEKLRGRKRPEHVIDAILHSNKNRKITAETRKRISESKTGKTILKKRKPVVDSLGNIFDSIKSAAEFHGLGRKSVNNILGGWSQKTRDGLTFEFVEMN